MSFSLPTNLTVPAEPGPTPPSAVSVDFSTGDVSLDAIDSLTITRYGGTMINAPFCSGLVITECFSLTTLYLGNCTNTESITVTSCGALVTIDVPAELNCTGFDCQFAQLDETTVDNILIALAAGTGVNGSVNLTGGSSAPRTLDSDAAYAALIARGWTVVLN